MPKRMLRADDSVSLEGEVAASTMKDQFTCSNGHAHPFQVSGFQGCAAYPGMRRIGDSAIRLPTSMWYPATQFTHQCLPPACK